MQCKWTNGHGFVDVRVEVRGELVQVWDKELKVFSASSTPLHKYRRHGLILSNYEGLLFPTRDARDAFFELAQSDGISWRGNPLLGVNVDVLSFSGPAAAAAAAVPTSR